MSLHSGKRIHGYNWDELPIDDYVVERVESLAETEEQPIMHNGMPSFEWAPGVEVTDEYDEDREDILAIENNVEEVAKFEQPQLMIEDRAEDLPPQHQNEENEIDAQEDQ